MDGNSKNHVNIRHKIGIKNKGPNWPLQSHIFKYYSALLHGSSFPLADS